MSRRIQSTDLVSLARGAAFLGTGGGGDPYIGRLFAEQTILECGPPDMIDLEELPDTANVFTIGMMGAPTVMIEKLCCGDDALVALERLERHLGRQADAIMPVEIGGMNSTIPIAVAARRRLPLVDADGMGRAFPELQMVTFNVYGIPIAPFTLANEHGECTIIESRDARSGEDIARAITVRMGLAVMLCSYPMKGADAKRSAVAGTLSLAREIGAAIEEGRRSGDAVAALIRCLRRTPYYNRCGVLFEGKVIDLVREATRGFSTGRCRIAALDGSPSTMELVFQNEHLVARRDGVLTAIVPDLISVVDRDTAEPVTVEALRYGQRVKVIGVSAPDRLRTPEALAVFGPRCFGLDEEYQPIETLLSRKS